MAGCGADTQANILINSLTQDASFPIPNIDLSGPDFQFPPGLLQQSPTPLKVEDITVGGVDGPGAFDALMRGFRAHLEVEWNNGRITGDDYTKAYIALTESAMAQSIAFLLGKDSAYWSALNIQVQAFAARVSLETAKVQLAESQFSASVQKAQYASTKMDMSNKDIQYCTADFNLKQVLPKTADNLTYQGEMLKEQTEAQRAQTLDTRKDGQLVVGVLGKQKDLYKQQITSYQRDSELKAARIWSDAWITQKTIDEGLLPPDTLENATVEKVLEQIRQNNNLGV